MAETLDKRTFQVGNTSIGLTDYENQLNNDFLNFYNTYAPEWTEERKNQVVQLHQVFMKNIDDGNITGLNIDGTFNIINPENSGIDLRKGKAGEIHGWYALQEANFMALNHKKSTVIAPNKFTNTSILESFLNNTFGGALDADYQSWYDLDPVGKDGKRGTSGRIAALSNFLNNFDLSKYTEADDSLGGLDNVKQRVSRLRTALSDGVLNNEDYAAGAALGFNMRTLLGDSTPNTEVDTKDNPTYTSELKLLSIFLGAGTQTADLLVGIIDSWKDGSDFTANIGKALYGATDYLNKRIAAKAGNANTIGTYYRNNFFPKFFSNLNDSKFSPEYLANHIDQPIQTWQGNTSLHNYINLNLTLAIRNKMYNGSSLLPDSIDKLLNQVSEGFWTVPGSFNEKTGTEYLFNPDSGEYKRVYIKSSNYLNLLQDYLIGKGYNPYQLQNSGETQSAKNGAKLQYGGNILAIQHPETQQPISDQLKDLLFSLSGVHNPIIKPKPTAELIYDTKVKALDKYMNDDSDKWSDADYREIAAMIQDIASMATAYIPVAGTATSLVLGLTAAATRDYNRATDPEGWTTGDYLGSAADHLLGAAGAIPVIGTGIKGASFAGKIAKWTPWIMRVIGASLIIGAKDSAISALKKASNNDWGKITAQEWKDLGGAMMALTGMKNFSKGKKTAKDTFDAAQKNGNITKGVQSVPEHWNYKFKVNGQEKSISLANKEELNSLQAKVKAGNKEEIVKAIKLKDPSLKSKTEEFEMTLPNQSKLEQLKSKFVPDSKYGFEHVNEVKSGLNYAKISDTDLQNINKKLKLDKFNAKLYNAGVNLGNRGPLISGNLKGKFKLVRDSFKGTSNEERFDLNIAKQTEPTQLTPQVQQPTSLTASLATTPELDPKIRENLINELSFSRGKIKGLSKLAAKLKVEELKPYLEKEDYDLVKNITRYQQINKSQRETLYDILSKAVLKKTNAGAALNASKAATSKIKSKVASEEEADNEDYIQRMGLNKNGGRLLKLLTLRNGGNIIKATHGVRFNSNTSWGNNVFNNYRQYILDELNKYNSEKGKEDTYGNWLNSMLHSHSGIYNEAGGNKNTWQDNAYTNLTGSIANYLNSYNLDSLGDRTKGGYNTRGISKAQTTNRYNISWDPYKNRNTGDWSTLGYKNDNYYSGITDDRRLLGRLGDWDENSDSYKNWQSDLNKTGWETFLDPTDLYYKLRRLLGWKPTLSTPTKAKGSLGTEIPTSNNNLLRKLKGTLFENATMFADIPRLIANTQFNNRNTAEYLKSVRASLKKPETFERNIYGDYATMNAYNTAGANALLLANRISEATSDASLGVAAQLEGMRLNNENILKGRLADNEMILKTREAALALLKENNHNLTEVANYNSDKLNENARERAGIIAANKTKNHDMFWQLFYPAYILKPLADEALNKKDMLKYLDYASILAEIGPETKDLSVYQLGQLLKYLDLLLAASDASAKGDTELAKLKNQEALLLLLDTQKELDRVLKEYSLNRFATLANREGLYYNYKPVFTPTYVSSNKKGGILKTLRNGDHFDTMVREKNKEADRLWKSIEEVSNRFWRQYGKMRQMK